MHIDAISSSTSRTSAPISLKSGSTPLLPFPNIRRCRPASPVVAFLALVSPRYCNPATFRGAGFPIVRFCCGESFTAYFACSRLHPRASPPGKPVAFDRAIYRFIFNQLPGRPIELRAANRAHPGFSVLRPIERRRRQSLVPRNSLNSLLSTLLRAVASRSVDAWDRSVTAFARMRLLIHPLSITHYLEMARRRIQAAQADKAAA